MKAYQFLLLAAVAFSSTGGARSAQVSDQLQKSDSAKGSPTRGQRLVDQFVANHPELAALEIALTFEAGCRTVAASAHEDIGEACDADELGPIRTGKPEVEEPTGEDPLYDITQALHDSHGNLIGAVGMDLRPAIGSRDQVVERAKELLRELQTRIPSKEWVTERVGG